MASRLHAAQFFFSFDFHKDERIGLVLILATIESIWIVPMACHHWEGNIAFDIARKTLLFSFHHPGMFLFTFLVLVPPLVFCVDFSLMSLLLFPPIISLESFGLQRKTHVDRDAT
jgi:hypothetical protein